MRVVLWTPQLSSEQSTNSAASASADLILLACRISLLSITKQRKRRLTSTSWYRPPPTLAPILQILHYLNFSSRAEKILDMFKRSLNRAGIQSSIVRRSDLMDSTGIVAKLLDGDQDYSVVGEVVTLDIQDW